MDVEQLDTWYLGTWVNLTQPKPHIKKAFSESDVKIS